MAGQALTQSERQKLSDTALREHARAAAKIEHQAMTEVIETIREVNRRKLYLKLNYTSLFDYVRKDLGYEGGTAQSRIDAARLFEEVPSIKSDFESGQIKITQVSVFSQSVKQKMREEPGFKLEPEAKAEILEAVKQLDVKQTQRFVAEKLDLKIKDFEKARVQSDDSVRLEITLTKEQIEDLARIKDLISHTHPNANWSQIIGLIAKEYRKRKDPLVYEDKRKKKRAQNDRVEANPEAACASSSCTSCSPIENLTSDSPDFRSEVVIARASRSRVPERIRRIVVQRDRCCQWVNRRTGEICGSTFQLEVDHRISRWAGGTDVIENLHALCDRHNRLKYQMEARLVR